MEYLHLLKNETDFYNHIVLGSLLPRNIWEPLPHYLRTWLRNYVAAILIYLIIGFLWCFFIYHLKRNIYIPQDMIPSKKAMVLQISVSMKAIPCYATLPTFSEYMIGKGWSKCFSRIDEVGWPAYFVYSLAYLVIVEILVYWVHRGLHEIKPLYKHFHVQHHIYNKKDTLSPFAGLALDPLDGIVEAMPHVIAHLVVPTHFRTHLTLLFTEALWTINIHDCIDGQLWPFMGAGYHTIHHTSYRHNYGHYTIFMDWLFGTLCDPPPLGSGTTKKET